MTREEAAREIDNTACCFSDKRFRDAMHMAAAALRGPQADPDTGLVPCGCGGAPIECGAKNKSDWRYKCQVCGIETSSQPNNDWAIHVWNCAMGYKGADE